MYCFHSALVVDDQKTTAMVISEVLKRFGLLEVETAQDGAEALAMLEQRRYDLVVSDLYMPAMDGLELVRAIRTSRRFGAIPFLMMSNDNAPDLVAAAQEAGADAFLAKPFSAPVQPCPPLPIGGSAMRTVLALMMIALASGSAVAADSCKTQATDKHLGGAALQSFMAKCERDAMTACNTQAGEKKLAGAAKNSFAQTCVRDAVGT